PSQAAQPRRTATRIDRNRLALVLAELTRHGRLPLGSADVFVNVVGGVRLDEPGADLAVALAVASANSGEALQSEGRPLACFGEVGLTGELRYVAHADRRVAEARKFGLGSVIGPEPGEGKPDGMKIVGTIREALKAAGVSRRRGDRGGQDQSRRAA
ncbi:MAG: DNA repair protein RadA, partial [bacterium]